MLLVPAMGENAVIGWLSRFQRDEPRGGWELCNQWDDERGLDKCQADHDVCHKHAGPDQFGASLNAKDIAEQKEVSQHVRQEQRELARRWPKQNRRPATHNDRHAVNQ